MAGLSSSTRGTAAGLAAIGAVVGAFSGAAAGLAMPWGAVAGAVVGATVLGLVGRGLRRSKGRRHDQFRDVALQYGWTQRSDVHGGDLDVLRQGLEPPPQTDGFVATELLSGRREGIPFQVADLADSSGGFAVAALAMPYAADLSIRVRAGTGPGSAASTEVQSSGSPSAGVLLGPKVLEHVTRFGAPWSWRWKGTWLLLARTGPLEPDECVAVLDGAMAFRDLVPRRLPVEPGPPPPQAP